MASFGKAMSDAEEAAFSNDVLPKEEEQSQAGSSAVEAMLDSLPPGLKPFESQVAGHGIMRTEANIGMLQHVDGNLLKPIDKVKPEGEHELKFYEALYAENDLDSVQLRKFAPKFKGVTYYNIHGKGVKFLILENITKGFAEPCVIDIKIGARTGDPFTPKNIPEKVDYISKKELGFCIPGLQVYRIATGDVVKQGKAYGRNLTREDIVDVFRQFLNVESGTSLEFMLKFLAPLWKIFHWSGSQTKYRLYSSSILLCYDARRLRQCLSREGPRRSLSCILDNALSLGSGHQQTNVIYCDPLNVSNNTTHASLVSSSAAITVKSSSNTFSGKGTRKATYPKYYKTYTPASAYKRNLSSIKECQNSDSEDDIYDSDDENEEEWVKVRMIDFGRTFKTSDVKIDKNYYVGVKNLIRIFENVLQESRRSLI